MRQHVFFSISQIGLNQAVWKPSGNPARGWWTIDSTHWFFAKDEPYAGVAHAEILPSFNAFEAVVNLSVNTGVNHQVYSLGLKPDSFSIIVSSSDERSPCEKR